MKKNIQLFMDAMMALVCVGSMIAAAVLQLYYHDIPLATLYLGWAISAHLLGVARAKQRDEDDEPLDSIGQ